jgi:tetratricopeptide (TPR) repeat protein
MTRSFLAASAALFLASPAIANDALVARCGDPSAPAQQAARACADALRGDLPTAQRALVALNLGLARLTLDNPRGALDAFEQALAADPGEARALAGRGRARAALGRLPLAAVDFNRAVALSPRDPDILGGRGAFRLRAGNPVGALADFDAARRLDPREPLHDFNRGLALARLGRVAEAERAFSAVIRAAPDDAEAWLQRGRLRGAAQPSEAAADLERAIALRPEWGRARYERGLLREALGQQAAAEEDFRRAWELGHRDEALEERIRALGL